MVDGRGRRVQVDDFQFVIADGSGGELTADTGGVELLSYGIEVPDWVIVHCGAHWGPVSVRSEVHAVPPAVEDEWDEIVEVSVRCETGLVVRELDGDPMLLICDQGGHYQLRMNARGRAAGARRYSSEAGSKILEHYLIQIWPADPAPPVTMREAPTTSAYVRPEHVYEQAGIAAARRIHRALDDAAPLSGQHATVWGERPISGSSQRLYGAFRDPSGWLTSGGGANSDGFGMSGNVDHPSFGDANRIVPCHGTIDCHFLEGRSPAYSLCSWSWYRSVDDGYPSGLAVPAPPQMTLRFDLTQTVGADRTPVTTVRVEHAQVPAEWAEDLTAYWQWMLERPELDFELGGET